MIQQAVLLAAGTGTRLMPLTRDCPKCMVPVAGRPIVDTLLDALRPLQIEEIVVVTGYRADALEDYLRRNTEFSWRFIHNDRFATTNNILSLYAARDAIEGTFLLVESDIYLQPDALAPLADEDRLLVAPYTPDMDGTGIVMDARGRAREMIIRAHIARPESLGEMHKTVNFYSFSASTWARYRAELDLWVEEGRLDQYYEAVLAELINRGDVEMQAVDIGLTGWAEVDDKEDLARLEARIAEGL